MFSSSVLRLAVQRPSRCTWQSHSPCVHDAHARGQQPHTQHPHLASGVYARASTRGLACARRSLVPAPGAQGRRWRQSMQQLEARARRARRTGGALARGPAYEMAPVPRRLPTANTNVASLIGAAEKPSIISSASRRQN